MRCVIQPGALGVNKEPGNIQCQQDQAKQIPYRSTTSVPMVIQDNCQRKNSTRQRL